MSWINGLVIGMAIGVVIATIMIVQFFLGAKFQKMRKSLVFVKHIEHHLEHDEEFLFAEHVDKEKGITTRPVVMCKICDTTIDDIYKLEGKKK